MRSLQFSLASSLLMCAPFSLALDINLNDAQAVSNAAKTIVENTMSIYNGGNGSSIPGLFPTPYYWWNAGLAFDSLVNYWAVTGDDTYNDVVSQGLLFQVGPNNDYLPPNQTKSEGNDDQATWALACMTAAEKGFPAPSNSSGVDSWVQLVQNVFDSQAARWDSKSCNGGLRWQIFAFNAGYDYKNAMSNGDFMQLAARLFHYTGNETYSTWATKVYKWSSDVGLIDSNTGAVYDGVTTTGGCKSPNKAQWTASLGTYLSANVYLFNATQASQYKSQITSLYSHALEVFAKDTAGVLEESMCAPQNTCNNDQYSFRAILARALANAEALTPSLNLTSNAAGTLTSFIDKSAAGAAGQCSGGKNGTTCGSDWSTSKWDGTQGLGQDLSALEMILAAMPGAPSAVRTENGTSTTGHSGGSATATTTNTNDARRQGVSIAVLAATVIFAYFACA